MRSPFPKKARPGAKAGLFFHYFHARRPGCFSTTSMIAGGAKLKCQLFEISIAIVSSELAERLQEEGLDRDFGEIPGLKPAQAVRALRGLKPAAPPFPTHARYGCA